MWRHLFGEGIVRTVDNFGKLGDEPTHPELLDYLADRFVDEGWSIKEMVRRLATSRAFRMSSRASGKAQAADPENRLLQHAHIRRLEAEAIRDAILAASGEFETGYVRSLGQDVLCARVRPGEGAIRKKGRLTAAVGAVCIWKFAAT